MRKIKPHELMTVIMGDDVKVDGTFKKRFVVHVGRITRRGGRVVAIACKKEGDIMYSYYFNLHTFKHLRLCNSCMESLQGQVEGIDWTEVEVFTPCSNTGVNYQ